MSRGAGLVNAMMIAVALAGCSRTDDAGSAGGESSASQLPDDAFAAAAADAEPDERPFVEPARPFLAALASRDYRAMYDQLSSHAKAKMFPAQFTPSVAEGNTLGTPLENVTPEQFAEWMAKSEKELGAADAIRDVSVFEIDPEILSGRGDKLSVMFAIGAMPDEIPTDIRRAAIRATLVCQPTKEWAEGADQEYGVTAEHVLSGQVNDEIKQSLEEFRPYMNVKLVLVDEGGQLKVGYFELMPPSMLD